MTSVEVPKESADSQDSGPSGYAAARLRLLQEEARSGPPRRSALAELTDGWLNGLFAAGTADAGPGAARGIALVAVGGYGRGELSPRSDLDLLLLHDGGADPGAVAALADRIWYPVWDLGLALDHSVRTPAEARKTAADDLKVHLGLLDARHIAGDLGLTTGTRSAVLADWRNQAPKRLPELRELCEERAARHGELSHLLEPDLKEARGGLRDATALRAVAASWLADAPREGLAEARRTLLDVRDALHLTTGRATDRLALQEQDQVAAELGLLDADTLLRQVYEAARTVAYAGDVTWREVGRVLRSRKARPRLRGLLGGQKAAVAERSPLAEGVVEHDGEVVLARAARPERDPVLPLRAAAAAAQAGLPLSLHAVRRIAAAAKPLPTPWPAEAREQLVTLLGAGRPTVQVWEALEAEGLITRLLPDWERVWCRPQRNAVHTWTVDRHLVETAVRAADLTRRVGRPDLLLVAALLHDIGKGWPGDHSVAGEIIARDVAARIGFDRADVAVLACLVRHHLLLVETATRRDLDDPATVRSVAEAVGSPGTLELLHALTEADALATGPAAWSSWRGSLVADLVKRVAAVLAGDEVEDPYAAGDAAPASAEEERLAVEAVRTGAPVVALRADSGGGALGVWGARGAWVLWALRDLGALGFCGCRWFGGGFGRGAGRAPGCGAAGRRARAGRGAARRRRGARHAPADRAHGGAAGGRAARGDARLGADAPVAGGGRVRLTAPGRAAAGRPGAGARRVTRHRGPARRARRRVSAPPGHGGAAAPGHRRVGGVAPGHGDRGPGPGRPGAAAPDRAGPGGGGGAGALRACVDAGGERGGRLLCDGGGRGAAGGGAGGGGGSGVEEALRG
ncbi:protein-PII uridylyltransferase [Streptomyces alboflavus]|uniref:Bifunctional uridylyltransferase/uridylyl-removing enzyme n=1 Tax=Streptomyces alboflavus TaxID=67267 RepID=A0A1Z1WJY8_9ACTN|nr:protein-PII uridylyltransferase [Streptomyces alboflavus]